MKKTKSSIGTIARGVMLTWTAISSVVGGYIIGEKLGRKLGEFIYGKLADDIDQDTTITESINLN